MKKIFEISEFSKYIKSINGQNIVLTGGVFNFLTPYHIDLFRFSKSRADFLVVAVEQSDVYTPVEERLEILEAIGDIDFLIYFDNLEELDEISEFIGEVVFNDEFDFPPGKISYSGEFVSFVP